MIMKVKKIVEENERKTEIMKIIGQWNDNDVKKEKYENRTINDNDG